MPDNLAVMVTIVVGLITVFVTGSVGHAMMTGVDSEAFDDRVSWCESQGGEPVVVHSVHHGGLHCQFENGTMLHLYNVIPENSSEVVA
jgi:hypothetical protein